SFSCACFVCSHRLHDALPILEAGFPRRLRTLFDDPPPAPARVDAREYAPTTGAAPYPESPRPLSAWLVAVIAALFMLERWLASGDRKSTRLNSSHVKISYAVF